MTPPTFREWVAGIVIGLVIYGLMVLAVVTWS